MSYIHSVYPTRNYGTVKVGVLSLEETNHVRPDVIGVVQKDVFGNILRVRN